MRTVGSIRKRGNAPSARKRNRVQLFPAKTPSNAVARLGPRPDLDPCHRPSHWITNNSVDVVVGDVRRPTVRGGHRLVESFVCISEPLWAGVVEVR